MSKVLIIRLFICLEFVLFIVFSSIVTFGAISYIEFLQNVSSNISKIMGSLLWICSVAYHGIVTGMILVVCIPVICNNVLELRTRN